jgi:hypothetical protein
MPETLNMKIFGAFCILHPNSRSMHIHRAGLNLGNSTFKIETFMLMTASNI